VADKYRTATDEGVRESLEVCVVVFEEALETTPAREGEVREGIMA
jgi:hypothetical protein